MRPTPLALALLLVAQAAARADDAAPQDPAPPKPTPPKRFTPEENTIEQVEIHGVGWSSPRGVGDVRVTRELIDAAPHQQTSEMLSAAPGLFVDHEDGEGLGNDVHLRGFDFEHGNGIEMRLGSIPINAPHHVLGPGYADVNFVIPEVVRGMRVLAGPYDPRQGDAAVAGSAYFDLGVVERGYQLATSYGSFNQFRMLGVVAPKEVGEETFAAFAVRRSDGFGENRASQSATLNAQWGVDLGASDHVRLVAAAYGARASLAGVVRQDDLDAGRIGLDDAYGGFGQNQSVQSARVILGADFDHETRGGGRVEFEPWFSWTNLRARRNFTGSLESSGLGDLWESANAESAAGVTARFHAAPVRIGRAVEAVVEPGVYLRAGHTDQSQSLLVPSTLTPWDERLAAGVDDLDAAGYLDLDVRIAKKLRLAGGVRADLLAASVGDRLANANRDVSDVVVGPRVTAEWQPERAIAVSASYGEGFRSLPAAALVEGAQPYTRVRSVEVGLRAQDRKKRFTTTLAVFDAFVDQELVFDPEGGGLEPEDASTRRGVVGSVVVKPVAWALASASLTVTNAAFTDGAARWVPGVAPIVLRIDAGAHRAIGQVGGKSLVARAGVGYTYLAPAHLTDTMLGPDTHVLNASFSLRWDLAEIGLDVYDALGLRYADDVEVYASNWSVSGSRAPSVVGHVSAAPPTTAVGTLRVRF